MTLTPTRYPTPGTKLEPDAVCTGETWLAAHALPLGLVDALSTSDAYLRARQRDADVRLTAAHGAPLPVHSVHSAHR